VDRKTGQVDVVKFVSVVDCGKALNPQLAEGQIDGAVVNGISYALTEQYKFSSHGNLLTKHFRDYKIWTAADMPEIKTIVVDSHEETGPYGAKGIRLFEAPFTPAKVYREMERTGKS